MSKGKGVKIYIAVLLIIGLISALGIGFVLVNRMNDLSSSEPTYSTSGDKINASLINNNE